MSRRFTIMFFTMILLANFFFLDKIEPSDYQNVQDRLLSLFLFQFDYFLLFVYVSSKFVKNIVWPLFFLAFVYCSQFGLGMSSILINDDIFFEVFYSQVQPILRLILLVIFFNIGLEGIRNISKTNNLFLVIGILAGIASLICLQQFPRATMWSFYLYCVVLISFLVVGLLINSSKTTKGFSLGLFFIYLSDLYYILPPEVRLYEFTYLIVRVINTIGEFLVVNFVLNYYLLYKPTKSSTSN